MAMRTERDRGIRIGLLGPIVVEVGGVEAPLAAPRRRAVLAALAIDVGQSVPTDRLLDQVWGDAFPATGSRAVAYQISKLRDLLEPGRRGAGTCIVTSTTGYTLDLLPDAIDVHRFEALVDDARQRLTEDPSRSRQLVEEAIGLVRGEPLADLGDEPFAVSVRRRLLHRIRQARLTLAEAAIEVGRPADAVDLLPPLIEDEPFDEAAVGLLMTALARTGRTGDGLRAYGDLRRNMGQELGIEPSADLKRLEATLLAGEEVTAKVSSDGPAVGRPILPPASPLSFLGRQREVRELTELLAAARLVTITGFGGLGKTSLARHIARSEAERRPGSVWFVDLTPVPDPTLLIETIIAAAGGGVTGDLPPIDQLVALLETTEVLIVIDNCEHLLSTDEDAAVVGALVAELVARAPGARILATSRRSLGVHGEVVRPLSPLGHEATVELLVERAALVRPGFQLDQSTGAAVDRAAARLDGIPLAVEMAAARLAVMEVEDLADNLGDRLPLLSSSGGARGDAQRSMEAVLDWSSNLLTNDDRRLLGRLAACVGGFDLAAATAICGAAGIAPTTDGLTRLAEAGLVTITDHEGRLRHSVPEVVSQHAAKGLSGDERAEAEQAHAVHYATVAAEIDDLWSQGDEAMLAVGDRELGNLRAAIGWCYDNGEPRLGLSIVLHARFYFWSKMMNRETLRWLTAGLGLVDDRSLGADDEVVLAAATTTVIEAFNVGDHRAAQPAVALVERTLPNVAEPTLRSTLLNALGTKELEVDPWAADRYYARALDHDGLPPQRILAILNNRAELSWMTGRLDEGADILRQLDEAVGQKEGRPAMAVKIRALVAARREQWHDVVTLADTDHKLDPANRASIGIATAEALAALGRLDEAQRALNGLDLVAHGHYVRNADLVSASIGLTMGDPASVPPRLADLVAWLGGQDRRLALAMPVASLLGIAAADLGKTEPAALLLGFAAAERERLGIDLRPADRRLAADADKQCRAALGAERFDQLAARGAGLDFSELPTVPGG